MSTYLSAKDAASLLNVKLKTTEEVSGLNTLVATHHVIDRIGETVTVQGTLPLTLPATSTDAFSRLRVSAPGYRFDSQMTYQIDSDLWDTSVTGGTPGTIAHSATERWALMTAPAAGATAVLQSHYHAPYTPGRGQLAFITFLFGATPGTGGVRKAGYWDGSNGIYLEQSASGINLVLASDTSSGDETIAKADWSIDPLDGNGPSGLTLDLTKMQILVIQMQALYVGCVTVAFDIGGEIIPVHEFHCANEAAFPYIQQASLPIRYEVATSNVALTMAAVCASVISEGGNNLQDMAGREFATDTGVAEVTANATEIPILSIQVAAQLNSINQNAVVIPLSVDVSVAAQSAVIRVRRNATLTGASFAAVSSGDSVVNKDTAASAVSGGRVIESFYLPASATNRNSAERGLAGKTVLCYRHLATAVGDILTVTAQATGTNGAEVLASLKWREVR